MNHCTACHKNVATIHVLDLRGGDVVEQRHLCTECAEEAGVVQPKLDPLKLSPSLLEDLITGSIAKPRRRKRDRDTVQCPGCGLGLDEFRLKGRVGCARCYETFRKSLLPLLERVHDATAHRGRFPAGRPSPRAGDVAELRRRLADAIAAENYEEAAALRDQLRAAEREQEEQQEKGVP